jgi:glutaconate CoA-transferase, subunit B
MTENTAWTPDDLMVVAAARLLVDVATCFVGIGLPSAAAIVARKTCSPDLYLVYESGTLGPNPTRLPLSVADPALADSAQVIIPVPEVFNYWLQSGRIAVGVLGTAQIDRFGNLNSTIIGSDYHTPSLRLPGAGGAPEIAAACRETIVIVRQSRRTFVETLDFRTTIGRGDGGTTRTLLGLPGSGPRAVVTDIGVYEPDATGELVLTWLQPGVTVDEARLASGWRLRTAPTVRELRPPSREELAALSTLDLQAQARRRRSVMEASAPVTHVLKEL